ncbi:metalloregulator ArsR/SmtB family transcription factor [Marinomonas sp. 2405UD66-6]|uniref:metalloregulator ArsR/SmtB family transcription factor n=1 Tax=Marinomonas sp. 2405UD66-6 TaxID=3391834 RepID=UPI0039C97CCB
MDPIQFYKCLSDETRLRSMLLIYLENELCVCELMMALDESQPKVSRHLALLRNCGLLTDRRQGQWVYYKINAALPKWALTTLAETATNNTKFMSINQQRLNDMGDRPERTVTCC